ncbi:MAG TPA: hypothetical protein VL860_05140 [Planctomycetota bacterium]|nr:hypothetical protein [Planctomycetota bacterium]
MRTRTNWVMAILCSLALLLTVTSAGCRSSEPLVPAWQPESHPAIFKTAYDPPPTVKAEPETEAMQKVSEDTRRQYFKAEIERAAREDAYYRERREQSAREEAPPAVVYTYRYIPQNTCAPDYTPTYVPAVALAADCTYEQRHNHRLSLFNTVVFGTIGGIIGHQSHHTGEGIAIGATYGLLHDLANASR